MNKQNLYMYLWVFGLVIMVFFLSNILYKPYNNSYRELSKLMSEIVVGIRKPDDISRRTTGMGIIYLSYDYYKPTSNLINKIDVNVEQTTYWERVVLNKYDMIDVDKSYCYKDYLLLMSALDRKMTISIEEDKHDKCKIAKLYNN